MKGQDIVILLKLASLQSGPAEATYSADDDLYSARSLEKSLGISKTEVNASLNRSIDIGIATRDRSQGYPKPNRKALYEFIISGLKYVFPAKPGALTRGIPTAFDAPSLRGMLMSGGEFIYVWPDAAAKERGQAAEPLFKSVPEAVKKDPKLYEYLALVDAVRLGNPRETNFASDMLRERLLAE